MSVSIVSVPVVSVPVVSVCNMWWFEAFTYRLLSDSGITDEKM